LLSDYKIANAGIKIEDKDLSLLDIPFIAQTGGDFVAVYKIDSKDIYYVWRGKDIRVAIDEFKKSWSGIALIAEPDEESIEPNYKGHKKGELAAIIQNRLLLFTIGILGILVFFQGELYKSIGLVLSLILNLTGIYISYLLILKQIHVHSGNADKICSLFKKSDCNNILESSAAKFMGVISWSEVGFSYFISNTIVLLFAPDLLYYLAVANILALPYSFWSIWYQRIKAKQWCPLCLVVQVLLWAIFIVNVLSNFVAIPQLTILNIIKTGCFYLLPYLIIDSLLPIIIKSERTENIQQGLNALRMNDDVFISILKKQSRYDVDKSTSTILFGNPDSSTLITILTNPHCEPCAIMHKRIESLLKEIGDKVCIQYVFSSFSEDLNDSNKILISAYKNKSNRMAIYQDWYVSGKNDKDGFVKKYNLENYCPPDVEDEFNRHEEWVKTAQLSATPTILYNGYELPENYKVEDLKYFIDLVNVTK
jgi:uncharacterized membrane protein